MMRRIDRMVEVAAVTAFAVSSLLILLNVANRYLVLGLLRDLAKVHESLRPSYFMIREWVSTLTVMADEVPGLLLVWVAFLGAYLAMRREGHISFDLLREAAPRPIARALAVLSAVLVCGFMLLMGWQAIRMIRVSGATEIETAAIAQGWFMLIMPLGALLLLVAVIARLRGDESHPQPTENT